MAQRFDAVVIGGGPAGAAAALKLARLGWRTALIERGEPYRDKTCGHCLSPRAFAALERMGLLKQARGLALGITKTMHILGPGGVALRGSVSRRAERDGLVVPRCSFDQMLRDEAAQAGVTVMYRSAAKPVGSDGHEASVHLKHGQRDTTIRCRLVVGADGVGSGCARAARFACLRPAGRKYGFAFDLSSEDACGGLESDCIAMFIVPGGYVGAVRQTAGNVHVGALVSRRGRAAMGVPSDPVEFIRFAASHQPRLRALGLHRIEHEMLTAFTAIGPMPWRPARRANEWLALVGDAAGYIEPFTGEGITWALASAEALERALMAAPTPAGVWSAALARSYECDWARTVGAKQRLCRAVAALLPKPRLSALALRLGCRHPALANRLIERLVIA